MFGIGREKHFVGLDIGSYSIKAVELKAKRTKKGKPFEIKKIGYELLPRDAIVEGTIIDSAAVAETIKLIFEENKITNNNVVISVSGNSVIIKRILLPKMDEQELAETIVWEAKHNIPYPYEETNIDYCILKPARRSDDNSLEILLVAAKKDKIANYINVLDMAKKNSKAIEVDVFALHNIVEVNYPETFWNKAIAIINIGANITNLIISDNGIPRLFRDLSLGGSMITENLSKDLNLSFEAAEKIIKGLPLEDMQPEQFQPLLEMTTTNIIEEIAKTFSFYEAGETNGSQIELILLSGGLSKIKDIAHKFEERFKIKAEILDPFRNIEYDIKKFGTVFPEEMASDFVVATGLAIRSPEE